MRPLMFSHPPPFCHKGNFNTVSWNHLRVDNGGGIVPGIDPFQGVSNHGFSEVPFSISLFNSLGYSLIHASVRDSGRLAPFHKKDGNTRVLTQGEPFISGYFCIFQELVKDLLARLGRFRLPGILQGSENILPEVEGCFNTHLLDSFGNILCGDLSHTTCCKAKALPYRIRLPYFRSASASSLTDLTASADFCRAAISSGESLNSMICSTPFLPSFTGTPTKRSLNPYSP